MDVKLHPRGSVATSSRRASRSIGARRRRRRVSLPPRTVPGWMPAAAAWLLLLGSSSIGAADAQSLSCHTSDSYDGYLAAFPFQNQYLNTIAPGHGFQVRPCFIQPTKQPNQTTPLFVLASFLLHPLSRSLVRIISLYLRALMMTAWWRRWRGLDGNNNNHTRFAGRQRK